MANVISMERHEEIVTELQYKIEKLEDENYMLQDELDDAVAMYEEYEEEIDELKGEIEELKKSLKRARRC